MAVLYLAQGLPGRVSTQHALLSEQTVIHFDSSTMVFERVLPEIHKLAKSKDTGRDCSGSADSGARTHFRGREKGRSRTGGVGVSNLARPIFAT